MMPRTSTTRSVQKQARASNGRHKAKGKGKAIPRNSVNKGFSAEIKSIICIPGNIGAFTCGFEKAIGYADSVEGNFESGWERGVSKKYF